MEVRASGWLSQVAELQGSMMKVDPYLLASSCRLATVVVAQALLPLNNSLVPCHFYSFVCLCLSRMGFHGVLWNSSPALRIVLTAHG